MKVATFIKPYEMRVTETEKSKIEESTDAVIRIVRACVCGSDLWWYRGISQKESGPVIGYQAEYLRYRNADWALVKNSGKPEDYSDDQLKSWEMVS